MASVFTGTDCADREAGSETTVGGGPDGALHCRNPLPSAKADLHRANERFHQTDDGTRVGDLLPSLILTCTLRNAGHLA